ncbi:MAG: four helix bundle protein [Acidobacteriales bacterium]|nr:four helix bundle protein [Terriglobales bacterium]
MRTKAFALRILRLFRNLPKSVVAQVLGRQLLRSAAAANYRAACRARSRAEFVAKLGVVVEEMDETVFWLELLIDDKIIPEKRLRPLLEEANELTAIFSVSRRTAKTGLH